MPDGPSWDPASYLAFDDHRSRPFRDLLARIGATGPRQVVDLGCGPGHLTGLLSARWPAARVSALDSSAEMVAAARGRGIDAEQADVVDWAPSPETDVVISNAVLQWVPEHFQLLPDWIAAMPPDGWFALQVPGNFCAPSHRLISELLDEPPWRGRVTARVGEDMPEPARYADLIVGAGADVDVWETTYLQRLTGDDPVLSWISATALRPVRDALGPDYAHFRSQLAPRLRAAYPQQPDGTTWFPFRRIFAVAHTR
ncbi:MAG: trans-aconitate 2-methyltransferase [Nakamurella sp.]